MSKLNRPGRKGSDETIIRLNSVGLSLTTIGAILECHPATISARLRSLNIPPADTRRTFMEDVLSMLNESQQNWLADQLGPHISVKEYVRNLIVQEYVRVNKP